MSFVWKADHRLFSPEQVARQVHEVSLGRGLDDLASVLALMCIRQESDFWCPWNRADPSSEEYDHDSESNDGRSVGYFQQQNGAPGEALAANDRNNWWGDMSSRMDLKRSTDQFLARLSEDYHSVNSPSQASEFISNVQHPRADLRGAYGKHWDFCWDLLRRVQAQGPVAPVPPVNPVPVPVSVLRPAFDERQMFGKGRQPRTRPPINFFLHTQEPESDASAEDLARYCQGQNGVSYHYTGRDGIVYDVVDTDLAAWAVLSANAFSINFCFAGSSRYMSRQVWLDKYGRDIEIAAYLAVQDARKYGFSTEVIAPPYAGLARPGISDHAYVTEKLGIGDHSDVGPNFPWDVYKGHVNRFATGVGADEDMFTDDDRKMVQDIHSVLFGANTESDSPYDSADGTRHSLQNLIKYTNASADALAVETGAAMGNTWDVRRVKEAADRGVPRAVACWAKLPASSKAPLTDPR